MTDPRLDPRGKLSVGFGPDERVHVMVETDEAVLALTDRRVIARDGQQGALDVPVTAIRRIQLDVEKHRPATLVVVPDDPGKGVVVLSVPSDELAKVVDIVARIGAQLEAG